MRMLCDLLVEDCFGTVPLASPISMMGFQVHFLRWC